MCTQCVLGILHMDSGDSLLNTVHLQSCHPHSWPSPRDSPSDKNQIMSFPALVSTAVRIGAKFLTRACKALPERLLLPRHRAHHTAPCSLCFRHASLPSVPLAMLSLFCFRAFAHVIPPFFTCPILVILSSLHVMSSF